MLAWKYSVEFRSDAVELVRPSECSFASVARKLGVNQETLRYWPRSSNRSQQPQAGGEASADAELIRLRREVAELDRVGDLAAGGACFAQEMKW